MDDSIDDYEEDYESVLAEFDDMVGPPVLAAGDDKAAYRRLRLAIFETYKPKGIIALLQVQEIVNNEWAAMTYAKAAVRLVNGKRRRAVDKVSHRFTGYVSEEGEEVMATCERNRIGLPSPETLKAVGLSTELIHAKALVLAAPQLALIDDLIANRKAASKAALNAYERSRRPMEKNKAATSTSKIDSDNDNRSGRWGPKKIV